MQQAHPTILIGILNRDIRGSIPTVTNAFVSGLKEKYSFVGFQQNRDTEQSGGGALRPGNLVHSFEDLIRWMGLLARHRPALAHYPVTSYWNFEKSIAMLLVARMFGAKTLGHLHGGFFAEFWGGLSPVRRRIARALIRRLDGLVVLGESWRTWVAEHTPLPADRIHVVNNPIDEEFERVAGSIPPGGSGSVLYLGALAASKGTMDLLRAVALLRDEGLRVTVRMAGPERGAGMRKALEEMVRELRLDTVSIGEPVSGAEKVALFRECGIFVLPSLRENFPLGVLEAAAAGRALVVTPVGATPEFFTDGESALMTPPGDIRLLAAAIRKVVESEEIRTRLGAGAREVFQRRLRRASIMDSMDDVYRRLLTVRETA